MDRYPEQQPTETVATEMKPWLPPTLTPHDVTPLGGPVSGVSDNATFHS